jgi:Tol biopolymer transport system component
MTRVRSGQLRLATTIAIISLATAAVVGMPSFGDWSAPADIESLPGSSTDLNSASIDGCASISPDGLTLAFNSFRTGNQQIYLATRTSTSEGFGDPEMLPATINTSGIESCPTITQSNHLYFTRTRGDPGDLFISKLGPKGWSEAERLGPAVNDPATVEESASIYEDDEGREVVVFSRRPAGPLIGPGAKIYQSVDGAPATLVAGGPHSSSSDARPSVTHDGRTIFWDSLRGGGLGIWYATRSNTSEQWGQAVHLSQLGAAIRPYVGWDGDVMIIGAASDTYYTTRQKGDGN